MGIDEIITLDDGNEYLLLLDINYENNIYFLASKIINNKPSEEYEIIKQTIINGEMYVDSVNDEELTFKLMDLFNEKLDIIQE